MWRGSGRWLVPLLVLGASTARADHEAVQMSQTAGGPIVTISATTLPAGRWAFSTRLEYLKSSSLSDEDLLAEASLGRHAHSLDALLVPSFAVAHGVTDQVTVGVSMPYVLRRGLREAHLEGATTELHDHGTAEGLGDLTVLGQFKLTRDELQDIAVLVGVKAPTGDTERADEGVTLDPSDQPGSGSWDPLLGVSWTELTTSGSVDANVLVRLATDGNDQFNLGHLLQFNFAVTYLALSSREREEDGSLGSTRLLLVGEANLERREPQTQHGEELANTGGTVVFLSPGVRLSSAHRWTLGISAGIPVLRELNGIQSKTGFRILASLGIQL
jgi:hypothetical protein